MNDDAVTCRHIYTDGACSYNGTKRARAGVGIFLEIDHPLNVSERIINNPTNQVAELTALKIAYQICHEHFPNKNIVIHTDSMYSLNSVTKWCKTWEKNNWKTTKGKPVKNLSIIKDIISLRNLNTCKGVELQHVKAHQDKSDDIHTFGNRMADLLAVDGSKK